MRLFIGVELDERVRDAAAAISESVRRDLGQRVGARWVPAANLHITLWFLGEVDESRVESMMNAIDSRYREGAFDVEISGLGAFPSSGSPRVFWLGVTAGAESLAHLHAELTSRLELLGFEAERRAYSAHLTIARVKEISRGVSYRDIRAMLDARPAHAGRCRVDAVTVFRSHVSSKGATYEAVQRVRLK